MNKPKITAETTLVELQEMMAKLSSSVERQTLFEEWLKLILNKTSHNQTKCSLGRDGMCGTNGRLRE